MLTSVELHDIIQTEEIRYETTGNKIYICI